MTEILNGLHSCKPGNDPIAGQVKTFTIEHRTSKTGKPWLKIKSASADQGGQPYRIVSAAKTDFVDNHGNVSYNIEIEPQNGQSNHANAPQSAPAHQNGLDERQRAIIRQHSQSMALELLKLKQMLGELTIVDLAPAKLRALAEYFDNDVLHPGHKSHPPVDMDEPNSEPLPF